jgi:hypothetical protein
MESNPKDYLHRHYRHAIVVMFAGWLAGLGVYSGSHLYARWQTRAAPARALRIWNNPKSINPSHLRKINRIALLDLIRAKQKSTIQAFPAPSAAHSSAPEEARRALVSQFVGVKPDAAKAASAEVVSRGDGWQWSIKRGGSWSDQPSDSKWWFVDPATGRQVYPFQNLAFVRNGMKHGFLGVEIALILSVPWVWYFITVRLGEIGDAFGESH